MPTILFTRENAKDYGRRGGLVRKRQLECQRLIPASPSDPLGFCPGFNLAQVRERLTQLNERMAKCKSGKEYDALSRSYDRFVRAWQVITGTPDPGQRRHAEAREIKQALGQVVDLGPAEPPGLPAPPPSANSQPNPASPAEPLKS